MAPASPQLVLSTVVSARYTLIELPVVVTFVNNASVTIFLLDCFEPVPVFFTFNIVRGDGTPLAVSGGGKIDFGPDGIRYLDLPPGEARSLQVDLAKLLTLPIDSGRYSVSATYHNQYGENCLRGPLTSNTISLQIEAGTPP